MKRLLAAATLAVLLAAVGFAAAFVREARSYRGRILPGVSIAGIPVAGLDPAEALRRVESVVAPTLARTLEVRAAGVVIRPTLAELGMRAESARAVAAAYALGREGGPFRRLQARWRLRWGADVPLEVVRDEGALRAVVSRLAAAVAAPPRDARVTVVEDEVVLTDVSREGRVLDQAATIGRIRRALAERAAEVEGAVRVVRPRFSTADALSLTVPVARYTTRFVDIPNRNHNIALAAGRLRGVLILPGEVFSFNRVVGPRTPALGYLPAPVLLNHVLVPGDGGGVCQVSSTLYNVALLADLAILERASHTRPVAYLPIGRDATVVYGGQDLRFRNTSGAPLLLWSTVRGLRLTVTLYGPPQGARQVRIVVGERKEIPPPAHTVQRADPELPLGQVVVDPPQPGYRVRTYRIVTREGVEVRRELVGRSVYTPLPRTIRTGTRRAAAQASTP
ncbi:MAG: VanW family protein [Armatimonadota bacterium]|nr:VanW family protein [Armatimonadota bacterium]